MISNETKIFFRFLKEEKVYKRWRRNVKERSGNPNEVLKNLSKMHDKRYKNIYDVKYCFGWTSSYEKYDFWFDVYTKFQVGIQDNSTRDDIRNIINCTYETK